MLTYLIQTSNLTEYVYVMYNSLVILSAGISMKFPGASHPEAVIGYLCFTLLGLTLTALKYKYAYVIFKFYNKFFKFKPNN